MVGLAGCGFPRPADVGGEGGVDGAPTDSPPVDSLPMDVQSQVAPSCIGLPMTCGAHHNDSCCSSPEIPGGPYYRSYDASGGPGFGDMSNPAFVSSFRLDKYEVTVGRFRMFVQAGMGTQANPPLVNAGAHPHIVGSGWQTRWNTILAADTTALIAEVKCPGLSTSLHTWSDQQSGENDNQPMNCVKWHEAIAFCAWDGGYLPTEAEWNYASAGGDEQRAYPWSTPASSLALDPSRASYFDGAGCLADGLPGCTVSDLIAVGTKPAGDGRWGQSDLGGNVAEWTLDTWADSYVVPCTDCTVLTEDYSRTVRGGGIFNSEVAYLRGGFRWNSSGDEGNIDIGFRCARSQ